MLTSHHSLLAMVSLRSSTATIAGIHRSGLAAFEQMLTTFLAEAQGRTFLVSILDHALRLIASVGPVQAKDEIELPGSALKLRQTMESLRASLLAGVPMSEVRTVLEPTVADLHVIEQAIDASRDPARTSGGQATRHVLRRAWSVRHRDRRFLRSLRSGNTGSLLTPQHSMHSLPGAACVPYIRGSFRRWLHRKESAMVMRRLSRRWQSSCLISLSMEPSTRLCPSAALLADDTTCPACRLVRETAVEQIEQLLAYLVTVEGREVYASSTGLCLPHLQATLAHVEHSVDGSIELSVIAEFLLREQVLRLENLADDLHSYSLKRDALRRGLLHQEEEHAWRHALVQLVGERAARGGAIVADQGTV